MLQHAVELEIGVPRTAITIATIPRPQRLVGAVTGVAPDRTVQARGSGDPVAEERDEPPGAPPPVEDARQRTRRSSELDLTAPHERLTGLPPDGSFSDSAQN